MKRTFTKYPSGYVKASYPAKKSEYTIFCVDPDMDDPYEKWDSEKWYSAVEGNLTWLIRDLRELPEVRSVRPGKIIRDNNGGYVEIPILFNVNDISETLWHTLGQVAMDNYFMADSI